MKLWVIKNKLPPFIPRNPREIYLSKEWISWGDFLDTGRIVNQFKNNTPMVLI